MKYLIGFAVSSLVYGYIVNSFFVSKDLLNDGPFFLNGKMVVLKEYRNVSLQSEND